MTVAEKVVTCILNNLPPNITPQQANALLALAGQKLGRDPQTLKSQLESGQLNALLQGMPAQQQQKLAALLNNQQAVSQLLENPQIRQMISQLTKGR